MANNVSQPAFRPSGPTVSVAATTSHANAQVQPGNFNRHIRAFNSGAVTAFLKFGEDNSVAASASADVPLPAGGVEVFSAPFPWASAVTASGAATVYFTPGEGL